MYRSTGQNPPFGTSMEPGPWLHANLGRSWGPAIGLFRNDADVVRGVLARLRPVATRSVPRALAVARAGDLGRLGGRRLGPRARLGASGHLLADGGSGGLGRRRGRSRPADRPGLDRWPGGSVPALGWTGRSSRAAGRCLVVADRGRDRLLDLVLQRAAGDLASDQGGDHVADLRQPPDRLGVPGHEQVEAAL